MEKLLELLALYGGQIVSTAKLKVEEIVNEKINQILMDTETLQMWKKNTKIAAADLNWEQEEKALIAVYKQFL